VLLTHHHYKILHNNVAYVLFTGAYGLKGINHFKDEADKKGVCVGAEYMMETAADNLDDAIQLLVDNKAASVIVCFCHGEHTRLLIVALQKRNLHHQFTVVGRYGVTCEKTIWGRGGG